MKKTASTATTGAGGMVSFRADAELLAKLQAIADRDERKLADTVRRIVLKWLALPEKVKK